MDKKSSQDPKRPTVITPILQIQSLQTETFQEERNITST